MWHGAGAPHRSLQSPITATMMGLGLPEGPMMTSYPRALSMAPEAELTPDLIRYVTGEYDVDVVRRLAVPKGGLTRISNLDCCTQLVSLALPQNKIAIIEGLSLLASLQRLDLAHNSISSLDGLSQLLCLEFLDVQGNKIRQTAEIEKLRSNKALAHLHLQAYNGSHKNPCCEDSRYEAVVLAALPALQVLDGERLLLRSEREHLDSLFKEVRCDPIIEKPVQPRNWFHDESNLPKTSDELEAATQARERSIREMLELYSSLQAECAGLSAELEAHLANCRTKTASICAFGTD